MALEQTIKDLQAQNAQFQEMFTNLVQGQKDLKKLITKKKKTIGILNMGRNHKGPTRVVRQFELSNKSGETEGSIKNNEGSHHESENEEENYVSEQYPPDNKKYKQLEDRPNDVENLKMLGLNFDDMSLIPGVVIPRKFKIPTFSKYDGISC